MRPLSRPGCVVPLKAERLCRGLHAAEVFGSWYGVTGRKPIGLQHAVSTSLGHLFPTGTSQSRIARHPTGLLDRYVYIYTESGKPRKVVWGNSSPLVSMIRCRAVQQGRRWAANRSHTFFSLEEERRDKTPTSTTGYRCTTAAVVLIHRATCFNPCDRTIFLLRDSNRGIESKRGPILQGRAIKFHILVQVVALLSLPASTCRGVSVGLDSMILVLHYRHKYGFLHVEWAPHPSSNRTLPKSIPPPAQLDHSFAVDLSAIARQTISYRVDVAAGADSTWSADMVPPASGIADYQDQDQDQDESQHQQHLHLQRQRQRQRQLQRSRRELRWDLPDDVERTPRTEGATRARRAGEAAVDPGRGQHANATAIERPAAPPPLGLGEREHPATAVNLRRSSLRRAISASPPPPVSSHQRPRDGLRRRYSSQSREMGVSAGGGGGGGGGRRRHSSSLGPTVRFRRGRSEGSTAAGEPDSSSRSTWESPHQWGGGGRWRQPRQLCVGEVVRQAAQRAAEDLLSVG